MTTDIQGCSTCPKGKESYETFTYTLPNGKKQTAIQYDFREEDGTLFSTVATTIELCRERRDKHFNNIQIVL